MSPLLSGDFQLAFMRIWGNFIINNDPNVSNVVANGNSTGNTTAGNPAANWPQYSLNAPYMLNLNETGGTAMNVTSGASLDGDFTEYVGPGLKPDFTLVDAWSFEGGRGTRCDFWLSMASLVPN